MKERTKNVIIWIAKLSALTFAIYWFMTDGLKRNVGESIGIGTGGASSSPSTIPTLLLAILIGYAGFIVIRSIYSNKVNKPKSEGYKKYREMK